MLRVSWAKFQWVVGKVITKKWLQRSKMRFSLRLFYVYHIWLIDSENTAMRWFSCSVRQIFTSAPNVQGLAPLPEQNPSVSVCSCSFRDALLRCMTSCGGCCGLQPSHGGAVRFLRTLCWRRYRAYTFLHLPFLFNQISVFSGFSQTKAGRSRTHCAIPSVSQAHPHAAWTVPFCIRKKIW